MGFKQLRKNDSETFNLELHWPFAPDESRIMTPLVLACSPTVIPRPADWNSPDIHIPGYLFLDTPETYLPSAVLVDFLSTGPPPVCVTFGSTVRRDAEHIYRIVLDALEKTGNRAIVLSGWSDLQNIPLPESVLVIDAVPHDWLLPRCKVVIHHGGAGTTAAGLRSGIPNLVVSFATDQPFWGACVHAIGAGPRPIPVKKLTTDKLITALTAADGDAIQNGAQAAGSKICTEDGVGETVRLIESHVENWHEYS